MQDLPALGVGLIYNTAIEPLLDRYPESIDVLEVEPQTTWIETSDPARPYVLRDDVLDHIARLPGRKLIHSVGTPVGGSVRSHAAQAPLLRRTVERLDAPWASEHLSFNLTPDFFTGFFLPPRQSAEGVETYSAAVEQLSSELGVPLAFETGVNYLRPRPDDLPDGAFMAAVAERADCGILLDLHNVYTNALNGRQSVDDFLSELPLERVWEVHLAGGFEMEGFWLDAHSGAIPLPLLKICREVIPMLPNLKAIIFELFASFVPHFGLNAALDELYKIRDLWALRVPDETKPQKSSERVNLSTPTSVDPGTWEQALGRLVIGRVPSTPLEQELSEDPGVQLAQGLIREFRASMVVTVYRLSSRLLMLALGPDIFRGLLEDFWSKTPPRQYAGSEGDAFADYLVEKNIRVPQLQAICAFERATLATLRDGQTRIARFDLDPLPMLKALDEGVLLEKPGEPGEYEIEIVDDGPISVSGMASPTAATTVPFH